MGYKGRGLARARLRDADDIGARENLRNGCGLDGCGLGVARVFERGEDAGFETEGLERHGVCVAREIAGGEYRGDGRNSKRGVRRAMWSNAY